MKAIVTVEIVYEEEGKPTPEVAETNLRSAIGYLADHGMLSALPETTLESWSVSVEVEE